jgi:predicted permease
VGVNVAIFSIVDAVVLRPIAVSEPDRIVRISNEDLAHPDRGDRSSWIEVQRFLTESRAFAGVTASDRRAAIVREGDDARRLLVNVVTNNYFDVFQVTPAAGRMFTSAEASAQGAPPMAVISYDLWRRQYNGDRQIIGRTIIASDVGCVVVGVLPRAFRGTELFLNPDLYLPTSTWLAMVPGDRARLERPQARQLEVFARLRPEVSPQEAAAALVPVQQQLATEYPQQESGRRLTVRFERDTRGSQVRTIGRLLLGVAALVLLIAAVNIANLLLVRGEVRRAEMMTRVALGASRARTVRQLVTEAFLLALFGAAGALLFAQWVVGLVPMLMPPMDFPIGFDFRLDARVLAFGGMVMLALVVLAVALPAFAASHVALAAGIKDATAAGGGSGRWRDAMVVGQVAITVVLLIASGLLVRTLIAIGQMDPGFDQHGNMLIATLDVRKLNLEREHAYYRTMIEKFKGEPGIQSSTAASRIPMWGSGGGAAVLAWIPGLPDSDRDGLRVGFAMVAPNYFATMGTRVMRGRAITELDNENATAAAVINQSAAHLLWPNDDAIGKRFRINGPNGREVEVVGIAQDGRYLEMTEQQRAYMFLPLFGEAQIFGSRWGAEVVIVRTTGPAAAYARAVRETLRSIDPEVMVLSIRTMNEHVRYALYSDRLTVQLVGSMGVLGLVLAAIGLFGVISYSVARRTREIGVRIAIGANPRDVVRLVLARASLLAGVGIAFGMALALAAARVLASAVYGVSVRDPMTYVAAVATMAVVGLLAAAIPARRAAAVDPLRALRAE